MMNTTRTARPDDVTMAKVALYIEREYTLADGIIDGEMIAEALWMVAWAEATPRAFKHVPNSAQVAAAREWFAEFEPATWAKLHARARYLAADQGFRY